MATIQRPVKTYGTRKYVSEVAAAPSNYAPVLSNEVDDDLDIVYAAWNGGADTVNIKDVAVTTPKMADGSITLAKLAGGSTVAVANNAPANPSQLITTAGAIICTLPAITTRGGIVVGLGAVGMSAIINVDGQIFLQWLRDGTANIVLTLHPVSAGGIKVPLPTPNFLDNPPAGTYTYSLKGWTSHAAISIETAPATYQGKVFILTFA